MKKRRYTLKDINNADRATASWLVVLVFRPLAKCGNWVVSNYTHFHPNFITVVSLLFWVGATVYFIQGVRSYTIMGSVFCAIAFLLDCMDGQLARLKNQLTRTGYILDHICGIICIYSCILSLAVTYYLQTGNFLTIIFGLVFIVYHLSTVIYLEFLVPRIHHKRQNAGESKKYLPFMPRRFVTINSLSPTPSNGDGLLMMLVVFPLIGLVFWGYVAAMCVLALEITRYIIYEILNKRSPSKVRQ